MSFTIARRPGETFQCCRIVWRALQRPLKSGNRLVALSQRGVEHAQVVPDRGDVWRLLGGCFVEFQRVGFTAFVASNIAAMEELKRGAGVQPFDLIEQLSRADDLRIFQGLGQIFEIRRSFPETEPWLTASVQESRWRSQMLDLERILVCLGGSMSAGHGMREGNPKKGSSQEVDSIQVTGALML
jgi:hypothetical protein